MGLNLWIIIVTDVGTGFALGLPTQPVTSYVKFLVKFLFAGKLE